METFLSLILTMFLWLVLITSGLLHVVLERKKYRFFNALIIASATVGFLFFFMVFIDPSFLNLENMADAPAIGSLSSNN